MAYPMMRSETSFQRPEDYKSYVQAEGLKRASYLANMDQFYANLEEATRQFNETLEYKEDVLEAEESMFGRELGETSRQFDEELEYNRWLATQQLELARGEAESESTYRTAMIRQGERRLDISEEALDVERGRGGSVYYIDPMEASREAGFAERSMRMKQQALDQVFSVTSGPRSGAIALTAPQAPYSPTSAYDPGDPYGVNYPSREVDYNYGVA